MKNFADDCLVTLESFAAGVRFCVLDLATQSGYDWDVINQREKGKLSSRLAQLVLKGKLKRMGRGPKEGPGKNKFQFFKVLLTKPMPESKTTKPKQPKQPICPVCLKPAFGRRVNAELGITLWIHSSVTYGGANISWTEVDGCTVPTV